MKTTDKNPEPATGQAGGNDKHTPGEWRVREINARLPRPHLVYVGIYKDGTSGDADSFLGFAGTYITTGNGKGAGRISEAEAIANARLIASAPSLLAENRRLREALEAAIAAHDEVISSGLPPVVKASFAALFNADKARAALAQDGRGE